MKSVSSGYENVYHEWIYQDIAQVENSRVEVFILGNRRFQQSNFLHFSFIWLSSNEDDI